MSYILDALNKSEQERQQREHGASLQPLTGVPHSDGRRARWLPIAAVAFLLAAVAIFVAVYFAMKEKTPDLAGTPVAHTMVPAPVAPPAPSRAAPQPQPSQQVARNAPAPSPAAQQPAAAEPARPAATRGNASESVKSLYQRKGMSTEEAMAQAWADDARTPPPIAGGAVKGDNVKPAAPVKTFERDQTASVQTQEAVRQQAQPEPTAAVSALPRSTINQQALDAEIARQREAELAARVQAELEQMQAQDAAAQVKRAQAQATSKPAAAQPASVAPKPATPKPAAPDPDANVPLATQLPSATQQRIPNIDFGAHVYAGRTNNGFVILNGKKRYAGDTVSQGLVVERITEDGVILDMGGTRFKLHSMSSWIN